MVGIGKPVKGGDSRYHRYSVLLADLSDNLCYRGHMAAHHYINVLLGNETLSLGFPGCGIACMISSYYLKGPSQHAAL